MPNWPKAMFVAVAVTVALYIPVIFPVFDVSILFAVLSGSSHLEGIVPPGDFMIRVELAEVDVRLNEDPI